jgi:hypothetical protein
MVGVHFVIVVKFALIELKIYIICARKSIWHDTLVSGKCLLSHRMKVTFF